MEKRTFLQHNRSFVNPYKYKFQEQERQDELGLNWDSFKWRNYDYAIGRFMSIDPLAEKYSFQSPYNFSENRVIDSRELEGLEAYRLFRTEKEAANNWGQQYAGKSIRENKEFGSTIGKSTDAKGNVRYSYAPPALGDNDGVTISDAPQGTTPTADIHAHGAYDSEYFNNDFSRGDKKGNDNTGLNGYLTTPSGTLQKYNPKTKEITIVNETQASDPKDPDKKNNISPNEKKAEKSTTDSKQKTNTNIWPVIKPLIPTIPAK
ncbi:DUF4329 domain-containing protein [Flavobacterium johnsoniae]|uniref:DUF4329 domain-containing protein n=1 Tax=Flavobacterium johnsoniae TaxID=986 RepID=UPI0021CD679F|nr:DUF4329 domain-containing protein [Flavobacterium johnsoniae]WQG84088.1 DUF4329 domain-containing protein [Flavobacterium johnsoniae UW101]